MDAETIQALAQLPTVAILVYLLYRSQMQNEKLLTEFVESERAHARNLVEIFCSGRVQPKENIVPDGKVFP